jgi:hypothetical protein
VYCHVWFGRRGGGGGSPLTQNFAMYNEPTIMGLMET